MNVKKLPISATIVVKDEEVKIKKCLLSIFEIIDEIILVHDGPCHDDTLKIATKYKAKVFVRKYIGEAEPHRNFSFKKAKHNWILQIDADEYLTPELKKSLEKLILDKNISGYQFKWNVAFSGEKKIYSSKLALFQKNKIKAYFGIPHETVKLCGEICKRTDLELGHDREKMSSNQIKHKSEIWPEVQGKYMAKYKYKKIPNLILPLGYFLYPFGTVIMDLKQVDKRMELKRIISSWKYCARVWKSFVKHRMNERKK